MALRLAIGRCGCDEPYQDRVEEVACSLLVVALQGWRARLPSDVHAVPVEAYEEHKVDGLDFTLGTHRDVLDDDSTLVVCQVLVRTWKRPTFFSIGAVGRIYAEGLLVLTDGGVESAPDELLWPYR